MVLVGAYAKTNKILIVSVFFAVSFKASFKSLWLRALWESAVAYSRNVPTENQMAENSLKKEIDIYLFFSVVFDCVPISNLLFVVIFSSIW